MGKSSDVSRCWQSIFYERMAMNFKAYCHSVSNDPQSPWYKDKNTVHEFAKNGNGGLGIIQIKCISLLKKYVINGKPLYLRQWNIARQVKCRREVVNRAYKALEKRNLAITLPFFNKHGKIRTMIIPFSEGDYPKLKELAGASCDLLTSNYIQKLSKSNETNKEHILSNMYMYIKNINKRLIHKYAPAERQLCCHHSLNYFSEVKKEKTMKRLKLAVLPDSATANISPEVNYLIKKYEKEGPDNLNSFELCSLAEGASKFYKIDFSCDFMQADKYVNLKIDYAILDYKLRNMLIELFIAKIPFNWNTVNEVIEFFNKSPHKRFQKSKIGDFRIKNYRNLGIAIPHGVEITCKSNKDRLIQAVSRLHEYAAQTIPWKSKTKIKLLEFLADDTFELFAIESEKNFKNKYLYYRKPKYPKALEVFRRNYIAIFFANDNKRGTEAFESCESAYSKWLDAILDDCKENNRKLCGWKFCKSDENSNGLIIWEYLYFLSINAMYTIRMPVKAITSTENWRMFIENRMRGEHGFEDFWKKSQTKV